MTTKEFNDKLSGMQSRLTQDLKEQAKRKNTDELLLTLIDKNEYDEEMTGYCMAEILNRCRQ